MQLKREFVLVHQNQGEENTLSPQLVSEIMDLNDYPHCTVTRYEDTITVACQSVGGLGALAILCINDKEGADLRFRTALQSKLVKFIG